MPVYEVVEYTDRTTIKDSGGGGDAAHHDHIVTVDELGDGQTDMHTDGGGSHFHQILRYTLTDMVPSDGFAVDHSHTIIPKAEDYTDEQEFVQEMAIEYEDGLSNYKMKVAARSIVLKQSPNFSGIGVALDGPVEVSETGGTMADLAPSPSPPGGGPMGGGY